MPRSPRSARYPSETTALTAAFVVGAALLAQCSKEPPVAQSPTSPTAAPSAAPQPSVAAAPASAAPEASTAPAPQPVRPPLVAAIGDSLTDERVGGGHFLVLLRTACPEAEFVNFGKGADMVNQMRTRFFRDVYPGGAPSRPFTHVIVFGGVNDLYSDLTAGRTVTKISRDLEEMYRTAKDHNAKVIAINVAPWGGFKKYFNPRRGKNTQLLNEWIVEQKKQGLVDAVIDAYGLLSCGDPQTLCPELAHPIRDGLHFGKKGHERLAEALQKQVFADCRPSE